METNTTSLFEANASELRLFDRDRHIAFIFWGAFLKGVMAKSKGEDGDKVRNEFLLNELEKLGATFPKIEVKSDHGPVSFYTAGINGKKLNTAKGHTTYLFSPEVDTPNLNDNLRFSPYQVKIGLPEVSIKIITGAATMHKRINPRMRRDLMEYSATM